APVCSQGNAPRSLGTRRWRHEWPSVQCHDRKHAMQRRADRRRGFLEGDQARVTIGPSAGLLWSWHFVSGSVARTKRSIRETHSIVGPAAAAEAVRPDARVKPDTIDGQLRGTLRRRATVAGTAVR